MTQPRRPLDLVCFGGICRSNLGEWASTVPRDNRKIHQEFKRLQKRQHASFELLKFLIERSGYVEPNDSVLGLDPLRRKSRSFSLGVAVGALLVKPLYAEKDSVLHHATNYVHTVIGSGIRCAIGSDELETKNMRGEWLMNQGGYGRKVFTDVESALDNITDGIEPDITNHLYLKAGAGLCMLSVWEGYSIVEIKELERQASIPMSDSQLATEMANLNA